MNTLDSGQYLDLGGLSSLRHDARETPNDAATLRKVAEQFESLFVHMLLKSQRAANLGDPLFDSNALDTYRDMQDQQMSIELSQSGGFGLADMLVQQLGGHIQPGAALDTDPSREAPARLSGVLDGLPTTPLVDLNEAGTPFLPITVPRSVEPDVESVEAEVTPTTTQLIPTRPAAEVAPAVLAAAPIAPLSHHALATPSTLSYRVVSNVAQASATATTQTREPLAWSSPESFVQDVLPHAQSAAKSLGVDPRVLVAQAALETGWGRHIPQDAEHAGFNLFGIKADNRWDGDRVGWNTLEHDGVEFTPTRAQFRAYAGLGDAVQDYADFIRSNPRYENAVAVSSDPEAYVNALQSAGYATDPEYADKIMRIYNSDRLNAAVGLG